MGYTVNDKLKFGDLSFDLQVEAVGNKVVGEIISNGKVLKKVVKETVEGNEKEAVSEVFSQLRELLLSRIRERAVKKAVYLKDKLSKFFEVEEEQVKGFLMVVPTLEEPIRCMKGEMTPLLEDWLAAVEDECDGKLPYCQPEVAFLTLKRGREKVLVLFVQNKEEGIKVLFAVSGVKLALVRRKLNAKNLRRIMASILKPS